MYDLLNLSGWTAYPRSLTQVDQVVLGLLRRNDMGEKRLALHGPAASPLLAAFDGDASDYAGQTLLLAPCSAANAAALRNALPWLRPRPLGLHTSAGCGDRLGLATPGHVRALRKAAGVAAILAQQSIRENARTGRTPQEVMDDAMWGVFQEGWNVGFGADADHLKTMADADATAAAGYTFFTVDPGEHVDDAAHTAAPQLLRARFDALPWQELDSSPTDQTARYLGRRFDLEDRTLKFDEESLLRAACKYGRAVLHAARMYRHLSALLNRPWELEVSVDETATPTSHVEHLYIASELRRLGVEWVSLAPRYVGRFEKGVDYLGEEGQSHQEAIAALRTDLAGHAAIARSLGPYKLSLHSGSDKFSVYPIAVEATRGVVHLKTAGTSYLEALRAIARVHPALFRTVYELAFARYEIDRASYHVSGQPERAPQPASLADSELPTVLDHFDAREMLHVTFGSALAAHGSEIKATLRSHEEAHYDAIETHFDRHLAPFAAHL